MGKYTPLGDYLRRQSLSDVPMTFSQIEQVIGTELPPSSRVHRAWWSNNPSNSVMTKEWLDAGFESEQVDMEERKLVFRRVGAPPSGTSGGAQAVSSSLNDAGSSPRHPLIGWMKGTITIAPGVDLTAPADPHWGEVAYGEKSWDDVK